MRIAIIGSRGRLGGALVRKWSAAHDVTGFSRPGIDLLDLKSITRCLQKKFDLVVNCAAQTNVDACESEPAEAERVNADAPNHMAGICKKKQIRFIHISTDYVFDGRRKEPYTEDIPTSPLGVYGQTKAGGERIVLQTLPEALVARVSWVFGPEKPSFIDMILARARGDKRVSAIADKWSSPSYTDDLADWLEALVKAEADGGIYHLCNAGQCSWREYGEYALVRARKTGAALETIKVGALSLGDMKAFVAERPIYTVLDTAKFTKTTGIQPATWQDAIDRYIQSAI